MTEKKYIKGIGKRCVRKIQHFDGYSVGELKDGRPVIRFFNANQSPKGPWMLADPNGMAETAAEV